MATTTAPKREQTQSTSSRFLRAEHQFDERAGVGRHCHAFDQIIVSLTGITPMTWWSEDSGARFFGSRPQDIIVNPACMHHANEKHAPWDRLVLDLDRSVVAAAAQELEIDAAGAVQPRWSVKDPMIFHVAMALSNEISDDPLACELYAETVANLLAVRLLQMRTQQERPSGAPTPLSFRQMRDVDGYIETNINRQFGVAALARAVGLGSLQFTKRLRAGTGLSPHQYVMRSRITRARRLLSDSELPLAEIALAVGFSGQSHFSASFKKMTGTTPARYRHEQS